MYLIKKLLKPLFLIVVALVIIFPRFYQLGETPHGLHIDEVSFAADAKSLAETGKDTWGVTLPRVFKAFGEYKAPGLTYSMAFWAKVTGEMNSYVARLPSAISGITILIVYGMTLKLLFPQISLHLLSFLVMVLAFSPWHFDLSRVFYESFNALSFIVIGLYFFSKAINNLNNYKWLYLGLISFSLAGYFYASLRYPLVILIPLVFFLLPRGRINRRLILTSFVLFVTLSIGWLGEVFSSRGLNRNYYYASKTNNDINLVITEKRQYCHLSLIDSPILSKSCSLIWNNRTEKVIAKIKTFITYLGPEYLFIKAKSEYGFDQSYGAYPISLLPFYLLGLYFCIQQLGKSNKKLNNILLFYFFAAIIFLVPPIQANYLDVRMALPTLYIVGLVIGIGTNYVKLYIEDTFHRLFKISLYFLIVIAVIFNLLQLTMHYYFVFTHSNDTMWTSDSSEIFGEIKKISAKYDRIIDTSLHGPLAPYFYGDLTTSEVQVGEHSNPDDLGFTYLIKAGKYELIHQSALDLACTKHGTKDTRKTLVITEVPDKNIGTPIYTSYTWNNVFPMHQIYDVDTIINYALDNNSSFKETCTAK